jgi:hypothetical protein
VAHKARSAIIAGRALRFRSATSMWQRKKNCDAAAKFERTTPTRPILTLFSSAFDPRQSAVKQGKTA